MLAWINSVNNKVHILSEGHKSETILWGYLVASKKHGRLFQTFSALLRISELDN